MKHLINGLRILFTVCSARICSPLFCLSPLRFFLSILSPPSFPCSSSFSFTSSPMLSYPILSYPILSYPILSYPILSYPILSYPILSYSILSYPTLLYPFIFFFDIFLLIYMYPQRVGSSSFVLFSSICLDHSAGICPLICLPAFHEWRDLPHVYPYILITTSLHQLC